MAVVESIKKTVKNGDLQGLSAERFHELGLQLNQGLGPKEYTSLHWACHYGKAEVSYHSQAFLQAMRVQRLTWYLLARCVEGSW